MRAGFPNDIDFHIIEPQRRMAATRWSAQPAVYFYGPFPYGTPLTRVCGRILVAMRCTPRAVIFSRDLPQLSHSHLLSLAILWKQRPSLISHIASRASLAKKDTQVSSLESLLVTLSVANIPRVHNSLLESLSDSKDHVILVHSPRDTWNSDRTGQLLGQRQTSKNEIPPTVKCCVFGP